MKKGNIAIITARGGSKRIPKKNIKLFCGKPIIAYSIDAALKSELFDEVMVSTDSDEIAQIAESYGASVPFLRSAETSNDYATTSDVLIEVLNEYVKMGKEIQHACCLYPTAPFISDARLIEGYNTLMGKQADSLIPVVRFSYPPQRALCDEKGYLRFAHPEFETARSQDLEPLFHDAGQFYFFRVESFLREKSFFRGEVAYLELSEMEVQDIDNETDWKLAELKYALMNDYK